MQHLTSVRCTSCAASLAPEDKASCALAARVFKVKLHAFPPSAARMSCPVSIFERSRDERLEAIR